MSEPSETASQRGLLLWLALLAAGSQPSIAQPCGVDGAALPRGKRVAYFDTRSSIPVFIPAGVGLLATASSAAQRWSQSCPFVEAPPPFAEEGRPGFGPNPRPAGFAPATSILVWLLNEEMPLNQYGDPIAAEWMIATQPPLPAESNVIILYRLRNGQVVEWASSWGEGELAHELGHAYGLAHNDEDCPSTPTTMMDKYGPHYGLPISVNECGVLETIQQWVCGGSGSLPDDEASEAVAACPVGCTCHVDPISPYEALTEGCNQNALLCVGPGDDLWFNDPFDRWEMHCFVEMECKTDFSGECPDAGWNGVLCCYFVTKCTRIWDPLTEALVEYGGPTVVLGLPSEGQSVSGLVEIQGVALEPLYGVQSVGFWVDNERAAVTESVYGLSRPNACVGFSDPNCPFVGFAAMLDSRSLSNGVHELEIGAVTASPEDPATTVLRMTIDVSNCVDSQDPTVSLSSPQGGATVQGSVTLAASAQDNGQIDRVEFYIDGQYLVTDSQAPYSKAWNTVGYPNGAHAVSAKAYDSCGNEGVSASVPVTVYNPPANTPPQLNVDGPAENGTVTSRYLNLWGWATDSGGVPTLTFTLDGQPKTLTWTRGARPDVCSAIPIGDPNCPNVGWSATMDLYGVAAGYHTVRITAVDNLGLSAYLDRTFRIVNSTPSAAVGSPAYGRTVSGSRVTVAGWATDSDGIESVRLEVNGSPVTLLEPWTRIPWEGVCSAGSPIDPDCPNVGFKVAFDSRGFTDGNKSLRVIARDLRGVDYAVNHSIRIRNNPAGTKTTKQATADTHVRSSSPSTVYGASSPIYLRYVDGDYRHGFVKFNLKGMTGQVVAARLKIRPYSSTVPKINVWKITSGTWNEATFNWNGLEALTWALHDSFWDLPTGAAVTIDVTDMVSLGGELTIGLSAESSSLIYFYSREYGTSSYRPVLEAWTQ